MTVNEQLLRGQVALVTGANSGIGEASARALAGAGAAVGVNYVTHPEAAKKVLDDIVAGGGRAFQSMRTLETRLRSSRCSAP